MIALSRIQSLCLRAIRRRQKTTIATIAFSTYRDIGAEQVTISTHFFTFQIDGNGDRCTSVQSNIPDQALLHPGLLLTRLNWIHHGDIPEFARRIDATPRGKLIALPGGRGGAA